jgi:hypothetical protein
MMGFSMSTLLTVFLDGYSADTPTTDRLFRAMMAVGWLEENGESLVMPRFAQTGSLPSVAHRTQTGRETSAKRPHQKRTKSGPEKRRKEGKDKPHIGGEQNSPVDNSAGGGEPDPDANNAMLNGYVAPGGMGEFGKFQMHDNWKPDPQFTRKLLNGA